MRLPKELGLQVRKRGGRRTASQAGQGGCQRRWSARSSGQENVPALGFVGLPPAPGAHGGPDPNQPHSASETDFPWAPTAARPVHPAAQDGSDAAQHTLLKRDEVWSFWVTPFLFFSSSAIAGVNAFYVGLQTILPTCPGKPEGGTPLPASRQRPQHARKQTLPSCWPL